MEERYCTEGLVFSHGTAIGGKSLPWLPVVMSARELCLNA